MAKPVPLLADMHRKPPPITMIKPPTPVEVQNKPIPTLSAVIVPNTPQPHSFEAIADGLIVGMTPQVDPPKPKPMSFAEMASKKPPPPVPKPLPVQTASPSTPPPQPTPTRTLNRQQSADFDEIMRSVDTMNWSGNHGPTCSVKTRLKRDNREGRELYFAVKDELDDKAFSSGDRTLYYYVGGLCPPMKAGFRISGHTKRRAQVTSALTHGVLHIDN